MAGKATRSGHVEPDPTSKESTSTEALDSSRDNTGAALKTEDGQPSANDAAASSPQPDTAGSNAAQDDATSRGSSEFDDKTATSSPSKKSNGRSKKGGRSSRGKSTSSKRSSEEDDANKGEVAADAHEQATAPAEPVAAVKDTTAVSEMDPSTEATEADGQPSSTDDVEATAESSENAPQKSASSSKELAQLGLSSFGDGVEDGVVGPRRSRRGPGASPDPKARVPKAEPDTDATSLQHDEAATIEEATRTDAIPADQDPGDNAAASGQNHKPEAPDSTAPEEAASDTRNAAKVEVEDEEGPLPEGDEARSLKPPGDHNDNDDDIEEVETNYADADEQDVDLDGEEGGDEGVTRCVCGSADENVGLMIQCETCKCWQHCVCMGMQVEEDCPDVYFCEQCRPELHIPLLRSLGLLPKASKKGTGKGGAKYSARELKEAKEAIAMLAQENARRQQAVEAAAPHNSRDRKPSHNSRNDGSKEVPKSPKRRSTMNSRDSAYGGWEPIPPGLLADGEPWEGADDKKGGKKRKRGLPDEQRDSTAETAEGGEGGVDAASDATKRRRMSAGATLDQDGDNDMDEDESSAAADGSASRDKASKKKKGNNQYTVRESSDAPDGSASKPRHPNQYTYRNKDRNGAAAGPGAPSGQKTGSSSTSNLTSHSPSPSPSKGRAEHARRAAARDTGSQIGTPAPGESGSLAGRGANAHSTIQWSLPDHLTHLAYLLPNAGTSRSEPLKSLASAAENVSANGSSTVGKKGSSNQSGQTSSLPSPPVSGSTPTPFQVISSIESSTKVRFPSRRMTMGEMRKRVRNIGEYVTRSQIEAVEREKRMKLLGIVPPYKEEMEEDVVTPAETMHDDVDQKEAVTADGSTTEQTADATDANGEDTIAGAPAKAEQLPLSMRLMEELTRELIHFQRKFGMGPGSYGSLGSSHHSTTVN
ncbi:PHD-finger motif containing protein [Pseudozyma hubeiensis SY62]|uniref:PHD-finger motif containing protein n=1 Tax=Pseudozyma hubeiensis (strain SY62) TaxID=1305764 RepID=R9P2N6_PSEHS|nr:PHD-finger motif containing protein [Pseudozyma hubeiensis SY62]GAC95487.1 PHD-finger motif containing protein [Pseudozyma hubeiensis SY62]